MKTVKLEEIVRQKDPELKQVSSNLRGVKFAKQYRIWTGKAESMRFKATTSASSPLRRSMQNRLTARW